MRTTTFTFRYWDRDNTTQHSFDVLITTPLSDPPFTPNLDINRILSSLHTTIPSSTSISDILSTYLFETFTTIPPHLDSTSTPVHFTFRGVHRDITTSSESFRFGDHYHLRHNFKRFNYSIPFPVSPDGTLTITEPPPYSFVTGNVTHTNSQRCLRILSVPITVPPDMYDLFPFDGRIIDGLANWDTSHVTFMFYVFSYCRSIADLSPLASWDTSHVTDMSGAFNDCGKDALIDLSPLASWDTSSVTNMNGVFSNCRSLIDLSSLASWDTSHVTDMNGMFYNCDSLRDISALANWNTSHVTDMSGLFSHCRSLIDLSPLASWNVSNVTDMSEMFAGGNFKNISPLALWDTSHVTTMRDMFNNCTELTDLSSFASWDVSNVISMNGMFYNCDSLHDISALASWDTRNVINMMGMFRCCYRLTDASAIANWNIPKARMTGRMFDCCGRDCNGQTIITQLRRRRGW